MKLPNLLSLLRRLCLLLLGALLPSLPLRADDAALPPNLGRGLRTLVEWQHTQPAGQAPADRRAALLAHLGKNTVHVQTDADGRVVVEVRLDGTVAPADVKKSLAALGATITSENVARRADGRDGMLSAHLPLDKTEAAAKVPGVFSILTAHRGRPRVGAITSQGVAVLHADEVQSAGFTGTNITVGVLSDSYNVATKASDGYTPSTTAQQDIATGDLPANGVTVLEDGSTDPSEGNTDEGRAMLQIVHDVAPGANLAFCTAGETQTDFANNIRLLRTSPKVYADILVDDIGFDDEPFFSDSIEAQAVDDVVTSTTLAGHPVIYYSAAGNDGDLSYSGDFTPVTDAAARSGQAGNNNLNLSQVPDNLTAQGFQNFKAAATGTGLKIAQQLIVSGSDAVINLQWDDPFTENGITANYNLLVFDQDGNYRSDLSGIDNNFSTGEAIQYIDLPINQDGSDATYYLAIALGTIKGTPATHLRYIIEGDGVVEGKYLQTGQPTLFGHSGATNADGVAAYDYTDVTTAESYESFGPVTIYFDANGNRLATPEVRPQPTIAAVDGVDTTFFPEGPGEDSDTPPDGFPNFYGTSAAAPHAAGVAALLLQAAGGSQSLTAAEMRTILQSTAAAHDLNPAESVASFTTSDNLFNVSLVAQGDASDNSSVSTRFFTLTFTGPAGSSLIKAAINIGNVGEDFDESSDEGSLTSGVGGFPFTIGLATGVDKSGITSEVTANYAGVSRGKLLVYAATGAFPSGGLLSFGVDRDQISLGYGGNDADLLANGKIRVVFSLADGTTEIAKGVLGNSNGLGYSPDVGWGLINAEAALLKLQGQ